MTHKIAHLINENLYAPNNVLAVTFTNKAADEMKSRVRVMLPQFDVRFMNVGTFHSIAARILRFEAKYLGFTSSFSIYDTDDSQKLIKDILNEYNVNIDGINPKGIRSFISKMKNKFRKPDDVKESAKNNSVKKIADIYQIYQDRLKANNSMDFDDLLLYPIDLFSQYPDRLNYYQQLYQYVLVDEYQDTNKPQFEFIRLLASEHQNITVVGDDDQSIYGWRGADVQNILNFEKIFSDVKIFRLEQNYRSTQNILQAAHSVVVQNENRAEKELWTKNPEGQKISIFEAYDERDEAKYVVSNIQKMKNQIENNFTDFAVLYRTNAQSRAFEESFIQQGIPYTIVGGTKFYARKEIKDVLAYLRLLVNEKDEVSFNRIINFPTRGIGSTTLEKIKYRASQLGGSSWDALEEIGSLDIRAQQKKSLFQFKGLIEKLIKMKSTESPTEIARKLVKELKLEEFYLSMNTPEDEDRWNNIEELLQGINTFCEEHEGALLSDFLENVSLQTDIDNWNDSEKYKKFIEYLQN
ncbi:MAG: ATP-dependent helicase, partial [Fidelibacterota bacterium]